MFAAAASTRNGAWFVIALALGLRQGETLGLRWDDVDFDNQILIVRRARVRPRYEHGCNGNCGHKYAGYCPKRRETRGRAGPRPGGRATRTDRTLAAVDRPARPDLIDDPHWPALATALDRADRAGYDVEARLSSLIARRPLPGAHAGRALYYRLGDECEEALGPPSSYRWTRADKPPRRQVPPRPTPHEQSLRRRSARHHADDAAP